MSSVPLRRRALSVSFADLGECVARPRAVMDEQHRAMAVRGLQQRAHRFGILARQQVIAGQLRADHARQRERPFELGDGGVHVGQRQRGKRGEAAGMLPANRREPVIDAAAQRPGHLRRLGLDPAERAEQRQDAGLHSLAVHPREMEIEIVEGLGERLFAHPRGLQHLDAVLIAQDARLPRAGAQRVGNFGGPPMGMHVDHRGHGCFLQEPFRSLTPLRSAANSNNIGQARLRRPRAPRGVGSAAGNGIDILDTVGQPALPPRTAGSVRLGLM